MPLYDYVCDACHHRFERRHGFNETVTECPECGQTSVRRVLHPTGVVFKGSGWYITDSRNSSESSSSAKSNGTKSESKTETKAETKPETKTETKSDSKPADSSTAA